MMGFVGSHGTLGRGAIRTSPGQTGTCRPVTVAKMGSAGDSTLNLAIEKLGTIAAGSLTSDMVLNWSGDPTGLIIFMPERS